MEQPAKAGGDRQEEHQDGRGEMDAETWAIEVEKWQFALSVLKEAVANAGIKDISEYKGEPLNLRWHVFSQESDKDVVLKMLVKGAFGWISADVSLIATAKLVVDEVGLMLSRPDATRILDFTDEERPEILRENARLILTKYVNQIPVVTFQILSQAIKDAVQSHIKTYVEPRLKEHWQSLGLPKGFTISPSVDFNKELEGIAEQFTALRKGLLGNRRAWLTNEKRANLDEEHEQLRSEYQVAKEHYNQSRKAFFAGKRNRTEDEWAEEWSAQSYRMFPNLNYRCLAEINSHQPYELAYMHLADSYSYSAEYIRKLVTQASSLKSAKP
jgi:hypothetical protein